MLLEIFGSIIVGGGLIFVLLGAYYWITDKLGIKHKGDEILNSNPYDLNRTKLTLWNAPIPYKIAFAFFIFLLIIVIYYNVTGDELLPIIIEYFS